MEDDSYCIIMQASKDQSSDQIVMMELVRNDIYSEHRAMWLAGSACEKEGSQG